MIKTEINMQDIKKLSTLITDKLAEEIQAGLMRPGERLIQTDLAQRFGVSRVAIRDALMDLRKRGLSVNLPMKGDIVRPVSCKTVEEVFALRAVVEAFAVRLSVERLDAAGIALIEEKEDAQEKAVEARDMDDAIRADWEFHSALYSHCDNEPLLEVIEGLWSRIRQARSIARVDESWGKTWSANSVKRHRALMEAVSAKNSQLAASIIEENIKTAAMELISQLRRLGWE